MSKTMKVIWVLYSICIIFVKTEISCPVGCKCDMFNNLRRICCVEQKLVSVEADIPEQTQYLDLSNNIISVLSNHIFMELKLEGLVVLNISNNLLSTVTFQALNGLEKLKEIDFSNNVLHSIPQELIENNANVKKLYLSGNKFTTMIPGPVLLSTSLQALDISSCLISHLYSENFSKLPSITSLDLSNNLLIKIDTKVITPMSELKILKLNNNKWKCNSDSELINLYNFLRKNHIVFQDHCEKFQRFQSIVADEPVIDEIDEPDNNFVNWKYDCTKDCLKTRNETNDVEDCSNVLYTNYITLIIKISLIIVFIIGILFGICISQLYVKYTSKISRNTAARKSRHRLRHEEYLLRNIDDCYGIGLSTPVLGRHTRQPIQRTS